MKFIVLLAVTLCAFSTLSAQNEKLSETSVVRDSGGMVYPHSVWSMLLRQGDYAIQNTSRETGKSDYVLVKLTPQQKLDRLDKLPKPHESTYFRTGSTLPPFKASAMDGSKVNLKDEKGKIVVINFWFINCPPCKMEIPELNELVASYKGNDSVRFLAVALDSQSDLRSFLKTFPFNYDMLYNGQYLADRYGVASYPTHLILDREGKVYFHTTGLGANTVHWIRKSINDLLVTNSVATK